MCACVCVCACVRVGGCDGETLVMRLRYVLHTCCGDALITSCRCNVSVLVCTGIDPLFFCFKIVHFPFQIFTNSVSPPEF